MVVSKLFWVLSWIPFIPATPIELGIAIWILIPQNEGEKVMYLVLTTYFVQFEEKMTMTRNGFFEIILKIVLTLTMHTAEYCRTRVDP
jgi:hypothetical protein